MLGDARLARAVEANWCAGWASLGDVADSLPTLVDDTPGYLRVYTPAVPEMLLNATISRPNQHAPRDRDELQRIIAPYRRNRLPFQWWQLYGEEPEGQRGSLLDLGMESCGGATCMTLALDGWSPPEAIGERLPDEAGYRVARRDDAREALGVMCRVFFVPSGPMARWTIENPAHTIYLTRMRGEPVAALAALRSGETVGFSNVGTVSGYRRRGLAGRLVALALREAQREGARLATLTATPEARRLYASLGFRAVGEIEQWIPSAELMAQLTYGGRAPQARSRAWPAEGW